MSDNIPTTKVEKNWGAIGTFYGDVYINHPGHWRNPPTDAELQTTLEHLQTLPTKDIPAVAPLPSNSTPIPHTPNPHFVGREDELRQLADTLKGGTLAVIGQTVSAAMTGLGGIGKTQLATEFVHRYGQYFAGVFWLSFADPDTVAQAVGICGSVYGLHLHPEFDSLPLEMKVAAVQRWWSSGLPFLLVFDNLDDDNALELLSKYQPTTGCCRILVTSRQKNWDDTGIIALALDTLPRAKSVELLRHFRPDITTEDATELAKELGNLPLALHLAGSFLRTYQHNERLGNPKQYLTQLRTMSVLDHPSMQGRGSKQLPTSHALDVARTFALSYERLNEQDTCDLFALLFLISASYCASGEPLPRAIFQHIPTVFDINLIDKATTELLCEDALQRLLNLGLLEQNVAGDIILHRLVSMFVQKREIIAATPQLSAIIILTLAKQYQEQGNLQRLSTLHPHLRYLAQLVLQDSSKKEEIVDIFRWLGRSLICIDDYDAAHPLLERVLTICKQIHGSTDPTTAAALISLANLHNIQGNYEAAHRLYTYALTIYEQIRFIHPDIITALNNFALLLQRQKNYTAALPLFERSLSICKQIHGSTNHNTAITLNNLAMLCHDQGNYQAAHSYLEQALAIYKHNPQTVHLDIAIVSRNLASLYHAQGNYATARELYESVLIIYEQAFGSDNPNTIIIRQTLDTLDAASS